jgi:UDP-glucose 6-dehydrogenase
MNICIIGLGFVGGSMYKSFIDKGLEPGRNLFGYDKFCPEKGTGRFADVFKCDIVFTALPTQYAADNGHYEKESTYDTCDELAKGEFKGVIVVKSTVEPGTTDYLSSRFPTLHFIHNPEFLTARSAYHDFHNQKHIILGKGSTCPDYKFANVEKFYKKYYDTAALSASTSLESETMKIFSNCFYAQKVQIFTEYYLLCQKIGCDYNTVRDMIIKNGWVNPMHTVVPGPDGKISYGGLCFPKDTNALLMYMKLHNSPHAVIEATVKERNTMRKDNDNCK